MLYLFQLLAIWYNSLITYRLQVSINNQAPMFMLGEGIPILTFFIEYTTTRLVCLFLCLLAVGCVSGQYQKKTKAKPLVTFTHNVDIKTLDKRPLEVNKAYRNVCLVVESVEHERAGKHADVKDIILTELYFSGIFAKVFDFNDIAGFVAEFDKLDSLSDLELLKNVAEKAGVTAFLYAKVNKNREFAGDLDSSNNQFKRFMGDLFSSSDPAASRTLLDFDMTFRFFDVKHSQLVWSKRALVHSPKSSVESSISVIKHVVEELLNRLKQDVFDSKEATRQVFSKKEEKNIKAYIGKKVAKKLRRHFYKLAKAKAERKRKLLEKAKAEQMEKKKAEQRRKLLEEEKNKAKNIKMQHKNINRAVMKRTSVPVREKKRTLASKSAVDAASRIRLPLNLPLDSEQKKPKKSSNSSHESFSSEDSVIMPKNKIPIKKLSSDIKHEDIVGGIRDIMKKFGEKNFEVPTDFAEEVKIYTRRWKRGRNNFRTLFNNGRKKNYFKIAKSIFLKYNLPEELVYIALYESGFDPNALSKAGALGLWQMMPATGYQYGLCANKRCRGRDDRRDPIKSSIAAAKYISNLIAEFGGSSIMLAIAAYNMGENGLRRVLRKLKNPIYQRNFWFLYKKKLIPKETRKYVLRIISAIIMGKRSESKHFFSKT